MIYVHERVDVSSPINILESVNGWENVCIKISQSIPFLKKNIIANIYRPPCEILETFTTFLREFDLFLHRVSRMKHSTQICADFNMTEIIRSRDVDIKCLIQSAIQYNSNKNNLDVVQLAAIVEVICNSMTGSLYTIDIYK